MGETGAFLSPHRATAAPFAASDPPRLALPPIPDGQAADAPADGRGGAGDGEREAGNEGGPATGDIGRDFGHRRTGFGAGKEGRALRSGARPRAAIARGLRGRRSARGRQAAGAAHQHRPARASADAAGDGPAARGGGERAARWGGSRCRPRRLDPPSRPRRVRAARVFQKPRRLPVAQAAVLRPLGQA